MIDTNKKNRLSSIFLFQTSSIIFTFFIIITPTGSALGSSNNAATSLEDTGRKLVLTTGCNDCHTPGYIISNGDVPERDWLIGDKVVEGVTIKSVYPVNIRLYLKGISEKGWIKMARTKERKESMPWLILREMPDDKLRAIYRFIKSLD